MVVSTNGMNTALYLLRQTTSGANGLFDPAARISNGTPVSPSLGELPELMTDPKKDAGLAINGSAGGLVTRPPMDGVSVVARAAQPDVADNSTKGKCTAEEAGQMISSIRSQSDMNIEGKIIDIISSIPPTEPKLSVWEQKQIDALDRAGMLIGNVMVANAKFHKIAPIDENSGLGLFPHAISYYNSLIDEHNSTVEQKSLAGVLNMGHALSRANVGNVVTQKETGEYKLNAFQIRDPDGRLVSELTAEGHYVEYNEDSSVKNDYSRAMTSLIPNSARHIEADLQYGGLAMVNFEKYKDTEFF